MKQLIDVTMTAVIRPEVVRKTLESFCNNLFYDDKFNYRLIINVDPIGENVNPKEVLKVAHFFFDNVVYNIPSSPSFSNAVIWVWNQIVSDYVFHLEDDWVILRKIPLVEMIRILAKNNDLACLHLYRKDISNRKKINLFGTSYIYKNNYYVSRKPFGLSLNPMLIRAEFINQILPKMNNIRNPEKQIRVSNEMMSEILSSWKYGMYGIPNQTKTVYGKNGLFWRQNLNLIKPKGKEFLTWIKEEGNE